jgi:hypothetical protein
VAVYKRKDRDTWVARLSGPDGRLVQKNFARKTDAVRWHADQLAARERGDFIDPRDGKATLARFYEQWAARQVWENGERHRAGHEPGSALVLLRRGPAVPHPAQSH